MNAALKEDHEVVTALGQLSRLGLAPHEDREKNWDAFRAYSFVESRGPRTAAVLDMGSATYGVILPWLHRAGWRDLHGCDLSFTQPFRRASIEYTPQNIERTSYPTARFAFVTCLSVIEHGVDLAAFFRETARVLAPGGYLLVSTDYWPEPVSSTDQFDPVYRCPVKIFSEPDIRGLVETAEAFGLFPTDAIDTSCREKVVHWRRLDLRYTFLLLAFRRGPVQ
jgi:SAM-dependent methyltransferase